MFNASSSIEKNVHGENTNIDPVTRLTSAEEVLLDPLEQRYRKNQRTRLT